VVWIEGQAGSGKSAFVRHLTDRLDHRFALEWAEADELSMDASFSLLSQYAPLSAANPFAAGLELIDHLASSERPVVVVAEDMHWADGASRGALLTAALRLRHDPVLLVLTSRPETRLDGWDRFVPDPERCLRVTLEGLGASEVSTLANHHGIALTPAQAARLQGHTGGHALHVRTLLTELTPAQLQTSTDDLPAPRSLAAVTVATLASLPPSSRELAAALAVLGTRTPLTVAASVGGVERPAEALEPLLESQLVRWAPSEERTPVEFTHPLLRKAIYDDLRPARRQAMHLAAAEVTRWGPSWAHRIAASDAPDDTLADELEAGAAYESARRELGTAAIYLSWAATVTSSRDVAEQRLLRSVRLLVLSGQTARAAALLPQIEECAESALRDLVMGMLALASAEPVAAERWLRGVVGLTGPTWVHAAADAELAMLYSLQGRSEALIEATTDALMLRPFVYPTTDRKVWWGHAYGMALRDGPGTGLAVLAERIDGPPGDITGDDAELLVMRGILHDYAGETTAAVADLRASVEMARSGLPFAQLPRAHLALSAALFRQGEWDESQLQARTAQSLLDEHRVWMPAQAEAALVPVLAARGEHDLAAEYCDLATAEAARLGTIEIDGLARLARAALAEALNDPASVVEAFGRLADEQRPMSAWRLGMRHWWPAHIRALVELDDLRAAELELDRFERAGTAAGFDNTVYVFDLRARLAVGRRQPDVAVTLFEGAVAALDVDHPVLDRARLHHAYGRLLRARGARREATDQLRTAHLVLERLGAETYLSAVAEDLVGWSAQEGGREKRSPLALTARERDVVSLVNKGFTNKEVGAQLYISAKAVEYHLGNVYGKLGIRSRRELRDAVPTS
jgi:ATP/maltotriose-dependent transcriptional regulator MalT